jgi:type VI secretion system secreted protein Hcp
MKRWRRTAATQPDSRTAGGSARPYGHGMTKNLMRRIALIAVPAIAVAGAGTAIAASSNDDTIRACVSKNGAVTIIDGTQCGSKETLLTWNQTGPAGAAGAQGPAGPQGPAGAGGTIDSNIVGGDPLEGGQAAGLALLDGVTGDAAGGALDVKSFRFGGKNTVGTGSGGGGAGKVAFDDVRFQKLYDSSSPTLMLRMASGQHIPSVTFTFRRPGAGGATFLTYKLTDVVVTSYLQGGDKERPLLENVELNFSRVEITFQPATGAPVKTGWDVKTNQSV